MDGGRRHSPLQHVTDQRSKVEPEFCENQHCEDQRREDCLEAIELEARLKSRLIGTPQTQHSEHTTSQAGKTKASSQTNPSTALRCTQVTTASTSHYTSRRRGSSATR